MIKKYFSILLVAAMAPVAFGQHSDIEFGYDDGASPSFIEVEQDETNSSGFQFFESEFLEQDPAGDPGNFGTDDPGFETSAAEGLTLNSGDFLWLRFLDASTVDSQFGEGYVNFVAQGSNTVEAFGAIGVEDNTASTMDLILDGSGFSGPDRQFVSVADALGEVGDVHVEFDLLDDDTTPFGTYGIAFQLESDFADGSDTIASEPLWVFFNHGLSDEEFEGSLSAFGVNAIPEPSSVLLIAVAGTALFSRRRRRA